MDVSLIGVGIYAGGKGKLTIVMSSNEVKLPAQRAGLLKNLIQLVGGICPPNPLKRIPFIPVQSTGLSGMGQ